MREISEITGSANFHGSVWEMVVNSGPVVQLVLVLLILFSIVSWSIILLKYIQLRSVRRANEFFQEVYAKHTRFSDLVPLAKKYPNSSLSEIFRVGYAELMKGVKTVKDAGMKEQKEVSSFDEMLSTDQLERVLNRACDTETNKMEKSLSFLATTASACPFIGLFGTVWGIMNTFRAIGVHGSATLAVVAPGISEALIATAVGLAAAIPAVIFYNHFLIAIRNISMEMERFTVDFLSVVERHRVKRQ